MKLGVLVVLAVAALGVGSNCNPPPTPDAGPPAPTPGPAPVVGDCTAACTALAAAGCSIGTGAGCPTFLTTMSTSGQVVDKATKRPLTCAAITSATVKTKADAIALGFACQ